MNGVLVAGSSRECRVSQSRQVTGLYRVIEALTL